MEMRAGSPRERGEQSPPSSTVGAAAKTWPDNPYKGLSFYTSIDAALFGGRAADVRACARIVWDEQTRVLLLRDVRDAESFVLARRFSSLSRIERRPISISAEWLRSRGYQGVVHPVHGSSARPAVRDALRLGRDAVPRHVARWRGETHLARADPRRGKVARAFRQDHCQIRGESHRSSAFSGGNVTANRSYS